MENIRLAGEVVTEAQYSHNCKGEDFYSLHIKVIRTSGTYDTIPCIVPEIYAKGIAAGDKVAFTGTIRSRNEGKKLQLYVFVNGVNEYSKDENETYVEGYVCRQIKCRETPMGRKIADMFLAVHRVNGKKSDYIPCIAWGRNAEYAMELEQGTLVSVCGRFQSREYVKHLEDGTQETRVAYELSISSFDEVEAYEN